MHSILRRYPVPIGFIAVFCAVSCVYAYGLRPEDQRWFVDLTATNIVNLRTDPLGTLVASAFVAQTAHWMWVILAIVGLFPLAHRFGNVRALVLVGAGQVIGTLLSEGLLAWRISKGALPDSMRFIDDVGPSYVIASALVAAILYGAEPACMTPKARRAAGAAGSPAAQAAPTATRQGTWLFDRIPGWWWRLGAAAGLAALGPHLFEGLDRLEVAAVGHVVAMVTGAALGALLVRLERVRPPAGHRAAFG